MVDEIFIVVLDVKLALHLLDLCTLLEELALHGEHLLAGDFALAHQSNELASIFQLFAKASELLGTLRISTTRLADLANLASTETDKWITIIGVLTGFKLQKNDVSCVAWPIGCETTYLELRYKWVVLHTRAARLPVLIDFLGPWFHGIF